MSLNSTTNTVLRLTESVCPKCFITLTASIIQDAQSVFMEKTCPEHGTFRIRLSQTPKLYADIDKFYSLLMGHAQPNFDYEIWSTFRCNMNCKICFFGYPQAASHAASPKTYEPTLAAIEDFIKADKHTFYCLVGAEVTVRDDLPEMIRLLKKYKKAVTINTNGRRLQDEAYLLRLKSAGIDRVIVQFDGFEPGIARIMRGEDNTRQKQEVFSLLKKHNISTGLNVTIARGVNEHTIRPIIQYALEQPFINGVAFLSISFDGGARDWDPKTYIMPDEIIDLVCASTEPGLNKEGVHLFQKLHFAIKAFLKQRACLYNQLFVLVRKNGSFLPIDAFINLKKAEPWLDRYAKAYAARKWFAPMHLVLALLSLTWHRRFFSFCADMVLSGLSYFFRTSWYLGTSRLISLSFTTGCDPYKVDHAILKNCQNEVLLAPQTPNVLSPAGSEGNWIIDREKRHHAAAFKHPPHP
jgi:uncharacterized radical SAM superfamily Fe-S cluster-containing enzyme